MNKRCCSKFKEDNCLYGYIILPCFKIRICKNCDEMEMICNNLLCKIFELFFLPFWTGMVTITDEGDK